MSSSSDVESPRRPDDPRTSSIRLRQRQGAVTALGPVDLDVEPGAFLVLVGASGCGKSTLLRLIAGFEQPTRGQGAGVRRRAEPRGRPRAWCSSSRGCSRGARSAATSTWRSSTRACRGNGARSGVTNCCSGSGSRAPPTARSGRSAADSSSGSRSRGRWPAETPLFLLDEPFAALDALTRERLQEDVRQVSAESGTHDGVRHAQRRRGRVPRLADRGADPAARPGRAGPAGRPAAHGRRPRRAAALAGVHAVAGRSGPGGQGRGGLAPAVDRETSQTGGYAGGG